MGVYLKGLELPKGDPITINIYRDGSWVNAYTTEDGTAINVLEPHGRMIDADVLLNDLLFPSKQFEHGMRELIGDAPTIIEAEEEMK